MLAITPYLYYFQLIWGYIFDKIIKEMSRDDCQRVRVGVRIRPLCEKELSKGAQTVVNVFNKQTIQCSIPSRQNKFNFDWAFGPGVDQSGVYNELSGPILESIFEGINATVLACKHSIPYCAF